jgi:DNA-binding NarL/FixJ family response regulator
LDSLTRSVLVVDDDDGCRSLVATLLTEAGFVVCEAATGKDARAATRRDRPGLVILDVKLPDLSGYELCRELRDEFGETLPIVFFSGAKTDQLDRTAGLLLGADDYVVKPFETEDLLVRVRRLAARSGMRSHRRSGSRIGRTLTRREREVLYLLALGKPQKEIANDLYITEKTVATHLQRILTKLGVHSRAEAVAVAHHESLVLD